MDLHTLKRANIITNVLFNLINHIISLIVLSKSLKNIDSKLTIISDQFSYLFFYYVFFLIFLTNDFSIVYVTLFYSDGSVRFLMLTYISTQSLFLTIYFWFCFQFSSFQFKLMFVNFMSYSLR